MKQILFWGLRHPLVTVFDRRNESVSQDRDRTDDLCRLDRGMVEECTEVVLAILIPLMEFLLQDLPGNNKRSFHHEVNL